MLSQGLNQNGCQLFLEGGVLGYSQSCWASPCRSAQATHTCSFIIGSRHTACSPQDGARVITKAATVVTTCEGAADNAHHKGLSQNILELRAWHSLVATAHSSPGCQVRLHNSMPYLCQCFGSGRCSGKSRNQWHQLLDQRQLCWHLCSMLKAFKAMSEPHIRLDAGKAHNCLHKCFAA